jgi:hypothetical protein
VRKNRLFERRSRRPPRTREVRPRQFLNVGRSARLLAYYPSTRDGPCVVISGNFCPCFTQLQRTAQRFLCRHIAQHLPGLRRTPLELLLREVGATSLVVAGLATNSCVLCTAHDANMRHFDVTVVSDCCAARSRKEHDEALRNIKTMAKARVLPSAALRF